MVLMQSDVLEGPFALRYVDVRAWKGTTGTTTGIVP
jgi:hypothetical protein